MSGGNRTQAETASSRGYTLNDVLRPENLAIAWKQVKANRGAAGIDGMEIGEFPAFMREHWEGIRSKLEGGTYKPSPVRRVSISKDGGGVRLLGIPTVLDRVLQQAISQVLTPLYDPTFSDHSHGFRPMRSAHDAIKEMAKEGLAKGKRCHLSSPVRKSVVLTGLKVGRITGAEAALSVSRCGLSCGSFCLRW